MATQDTKRTVTIWINGKEVDKTYSAILKQQREITSSLNKMVMGSDEYNKKAKELTNVNRVLSEHKKVLKGAQQEAGGLMGAFKSL